MSLNCTAYAEGLDAANEFFYGEEGDLPTNPYTKDSLAYNDWNNGFTFVETEYNNRFPNDN